MQTLATWNVNSLSVRLPHVLQWLQSQSEHLLVDVLGLQELKITDDKFPQEAIRAAGYHAVFSGQKTYNGVAILSRYPMSEVVKNNPLFHDPQQRLIAATVHSPLGKCRVICVYVPNGQAVTSDKFTYKLDWLSALTQWLKSECSRYRQLALIGDYNIAPEDQDVHDPDVWQGQNLVSPQERAAFACFKVLGLHDAFRCFAQADRCYSWWDYRSLGFRLNKGLRIDHILLSSCLAKRCVSCVIDKTPRKWEKPSDHAPVVAVFKEPEL